MPGGDDSSDKLRSEVTVLLQRVNAGDADAPDELMQSLYKELHRLAEALMRRERPGHTLQPTALVSEAYLRLFDRLSQWENRAHFFGAAARAMRRVLIEHGRKRASLKRGGEIARVTFDDLHVAAEDPDLDLLALDEALNDLNDVDSRLVQVVELRYFAGCSVEQAAELLGVSPATVKRDWTFARAWLYDRMQGATG